MLTTVLARKLIGMNPKLIEFAIGLFLLKRKNSNKQVKEYMEDYINEKSTDLNGMITYFHVVYLKIKSSDNTFHEKYERLYELLQNHWQLMIQSMLSPLKLNRLAEILIQLCFLQNNKESPYCVHILAHLIFCLEFLLWNDPNGECSDLTLILMKTFDQIAGVKQDDPILNQWLSNLLQIQTIQQEVKTHPIILWAQTLLNLLLTM